MGWQDMNWQDVALTAAGVIGGGVAVIHGALVQRLMVRPLDAMTRCTPGASASLRRLTPPLLQFSTYNWLLGGLALIAVGAGVAPGARLAVCLLVGSSYLFGAVGNLWATRGRHPGWALYAVALALIAFGAAPNA